MLLDEGVGHWISSKPAGLKSAALAWSARFPGDKSEDEAAVYQFAWTNPRADVAISSIDMVYGKDGRPLRHAGPLGRDGRDGAMNSAGGPPTLRDLVPSRFTPGCLA